MRTHLAGPLRPLLLVLGLALLAACGTADPAGDRGTATPTASSPTSGGGRTPAPGGLTVVMQRSGGIRPEQAAVSVGPDGRISTGPTVENLVASSKTLPAAQLKELQALLADPALTPTTSTSDAPSCCDHQTLRLTVTGLSRPVTIVLVDGKPRSRPLDRVVRLLSPLLPRHGARMLVPFPGKSFWPPIPQ